MSTRCGTVCTHLSGTAYMCICTVQYKATVKLMLPYCIRLNGSVVVIEPSSYSRFTVEWFRTFRPDTCVDLCQQIKSFSNFQPGRTEPFWVIVLQLCNVCLGLVWPPIYTYVSVCMYVCTYLRTWQWIDILLEWKCWASLWRVRMYVHYTLSYLCVHSPRCTVVWSTALTIQCVLGLQPDMCNSQFSHIICFDPPLCDAVPCNINCPCWNVEENPQVAHTCFSVRVLHSSPPAYSLEVCVRLEYLTDPGWECAQRETPPTGFKALSARHDQLKLIP